jgi:hypothetical protein
MPSQCSQVLQNILGRAGAHVAQTSGSNGMVDAKW